jgi:hypothetical protein
MGLVGQGTRLGDSIRLLHAVERLEAHGADERRESSDYDRRMNTAQGSAHGG